MVRPSKSAGVAFVLTFLFGPFGLFYSSVVGGVVMLLVELFVLVLGLATFGAGWLLFGVCWFVCILWGCLAASN